MSFLASNRGHCFPRKDIIIWILQLKEKYGEFESFTISFLTLNRGESRVLSSHFSRYDEENNSIGVKKQSRGGKEIFTISLFSSMRRKEREIRNSIDLKIEVKVSRIWNWEEEDGHLKIFAIVFSVESPHKYARTEFSRHDETGKLHRARLERR